MNKKKGLFRSMMTTFVLIAAFTVNVFAGGTTQNEVEMTYDVNENRFVIYVENEQQKEYVLSELEKNNAKVEAMWQEALRKADELQPSVALARATQTYYSENVRISQLFGFNGYHGLRGYTYLDSDGTTRFSKCSNVVVTPKYSEEQEISGHDYDVVPMDTSRTYAVRSSAYLTIYYENDEGGKDSYTDPLELYTEFYANGGGKNYN